MIKGRVVFVPLTDMQMLTAVSAILISAWNAGKTFCISIVDIATGRLMSFPMEGTMLGSCDRPGDQGVASQKATTMYLTGVNKSSEIGDDWITKPADKETGITPHREIAYLGDPAKLTGYAGGVKFQRNKHIDDGYGLFYTLRTEAYICCSGDDGEIDEKFARIGVNALMEAENEGPSMIEIKLP